jgi:hypothetical protein
MKITYQLFIHYRYPRFVVGFFKLQPTLSGIVCYCITAWSNPLSALHLRVVLHVTIIEKHLSFLLFQKVLSFLTVIIKLIINLQIYRTTQLNPYYWRNHYGKGGLTCVRTHNKNIFTALLWVLCNVNSMAIQFDKQGDWIRIGINYQKLHKTKKEGVTEQLHIAAE